MTPELYDQLAVARWRAAKAVPYLSRALWAASFIECEDVPTFAIDERWRVYVNPKYALSCVPKGTLPGALIHEVLHPTLKHGPRAKVIAADDKAHWNACGDCEINQRIEHAHVQTDPAWVFPKTLNAPDDLSAEEYYRLPRPPQQNQKSGKGVAGALPCDGGSGAGNPQPFEKPGPGGDDDGDTPAGLDPAEGDLVRVAVANAVKDHAETYGRGSVPAGMLRWAEELCEPPPVPWGQLVQSRIRYATENRRGPAPTYARPSRRRVPGGLVLPVHRLPVPRIAMVIDTSGSMGDHDLGIALSTAADACLTLGKVTAVACDAAVGEMTDIRQLEDLRPYLTGGGGTDMSVGIKRASECMPDAIVVVTDGETPWPSEAPDCPVVIVLTRGDPSFCGRPPAWAEVIVADDGGRGGRRKTKR
jgi:predicted metal-dependent peptidase